MARITDTEEVLPLLIVEHHLDMRWLLDTENAPVGLIACGQYITARKRAEQEMQRADRLALVGQLASGLAHEIGMPLNVIAGNAELLWQDLLAQGLAAAELETVVVQADRITRLMERLLALARAKEQPMASLSLQTALTHAMPRGGTVLVAGVYWFAYLRPDARAGPAR